MPKADTKSQQIKKLRTALNKGPASAFDSVAQRVAAPTHDFGDIAVAPGERGWVPAGNNTYYWASRSQQTGMPPNGGTQVRRPELAQADDSHHAKRGGSMKSLRTIPDHDNQSLDMLAHFAHQQANGAGLFYAESLEPRGLGPQRVRTSIPYRDPNEHRKIFSKMTGGESSSTRYQQALGTAHPGMNYQILHMLGHGEGGRQTQSPANLVSASEGANSAMIPFDKAFSGDDDWVNDTVGWVQPGTHRAEYIDQRYFHQAFPDMPIFSQRIDGDTPKQTRSQYEQLEAEAAGYRGDKDERFAAAALLHVRRTADAMDESTEDRR